MHVGLTKTPLEHLMLLSCELTYILWDQKILWLWSLIVKAKLLMEAQIFIVNNVSFLNSHWDRFCALKWLYNHWSLCCLFIYISPISHVFPIIQLINKKWSPILRVVLLWIRCFTLISMHCQPSASVCGGSGHLLSWHTFIIICSQLQTPLILILSSDNS